MYYADTRIYRLALELVELIQQIVNQSPAGRAFLCDQLLRASSSIPLNYIEGCGRRTPKDRRRFFNMAKASAYEVYAALDVALLLNAVSPELAARGKDHCDHLAGMLSKFR